MAPAPLWRRRGNVAIAAATLTAIFTLALGFALTVFTSPVARADAPGSPPGQSKVADDTGQAASAAPRFKAHGPITVTTATPTLTGVGFPGGDSTLTLVVSGTSSSGDDMTGRSCTATSSGNGGWSCTFATPLASGTYKVTLDHHLGNGKTVETTSCQLIVALPAATPPVIETTPPVVETTPPVVDQTPEQTGEVSTPKSEVKTTAPAPRATTPPAAPAAVPAAAAAPQATSTTTPRSTPRATHAAVVVPPTIEWSFSIVDADGNDIGGRPLVPGEHLSVVASGLPEGAQVDVEIHSTPVSLVSATVDGTGSLVAPFTLPVTTEAGAHDLVATLRADGISASVSSLPVIVAPAKTETIVLAEGPAPAVTLTPVPPELTVHRLSDVLRTWSDLTVTPFTVAAAGGLAAAFVLLAALPAELLQNTLTENYGRAFGWLTPVRRRTRSLRRFVPSRLDNPWAGSAVSVALSAVILGFSEPQFGFNAWSIRTFLALYLSLYAINVVVNVLKLGYAARRFDVNGVMSPLPGGMIIAAVSVLVSRWLHIEPSLLFGLVVGITLARVQSKEAEGRIALFGAATILGLGIVSWLGLSAVETFLGHDTNFVVGLTEDTLAATALEALTILLVGLLPFDYLEGKALHDWDQRIWAASYFVAAAAFVFIAVPLGETWDQSQQPVLMWVLIVAGFAAISIAAWLAFHVLPEHRHQRDDEHAQV
ncbi:hypothetical protein [Demequina capsici]|uniref:Uncharacterized protein n=1 Tax=Demequina capsici TaxID=3075620 RepID=A0AA96J7T3_9MICO|nr:hypothetical protein [Demequina sp. OYTSA14]WNM25527.1 hypothetical protein RN606_05110 [Demequina sp. OYTSA14]